jgi:acyl carrier protein
MQSNLTQVRDIILSQFPSLAPKDLINDVALSNQIGLDSIGIIQLCLAIEQVFEIQLDGVYLDTEHYESVLSIVELVELATKQRG